MGRFLQVDLAGCFARNARRCPSGLAPEARGVRVKAMCSYQSIHVAVMAEGSLEGYLRLVQ